MFGRGAERRPNDAVDIVGPSPASSSALAEASSISCSSFLPEPRVNALSPTPTIHALSFSDSVYFTDTPGAAPMSLISFA
jgi:hypothetical protein